MASENLNAEEIARLTFELFNAAKEGYPEVIESVLSQGIDPESRDERGNTPLIIAAEHGQIGVINKLIEFWDADLEARNHEGDTALIRGVKRSRYQTCATLLEAGANPNGANVRGETPLYQICLQRRGDYFLHLLIKHGAEVDIPKYHNELSPAQTPLLLCCFSGNEGHAKILLEHGADPNLDIRDFSPIDSVVRMGRDRMLHLLLEHGAIPHRKSPEGQTPLQRSMEQINPACTAVLLKYGALKELTNTELNGLLDFDYGEIEPNEYENLKRVKHMVRLAVISEMGKPWRGRPQEVESLIER